METALPLAIFVVIALIAFLLLSAKKFVDYSRWSKHSRFDLYPIPKEGAEKNKYGGSYYEENEWWEKGRYTSVATEVTDLAPEMFFIRKLFLHQRALWYASFLFHFGIYFLFGWSIMLLVGGLWYPHPEWVSVIIGIVGYIGFILATVGCVGLLIRRIFSASARINMTPVEYFNLFFILAVLVTGIVSWLGFADPITIAHEILTMSLVNVPVIVVVHLIMLGILLIYIPMSRMAHYAGKYFAFHKVMWDNDPNTAGSKVEQDVIEMNSRKPKDHWSAPHIQA